MCLRKSLLRIRLAAEAQEGGSRLSRALSVLKLMVSRFSASHPSVGALVDMDGQKQMGVLGLCRRVAGYPQQRAEGRWPAHDCFARCRGRILGACPVEQRVRTVQGLTGGQL